MARKPHAKGQPNGAFGKKSDTFSTMFSQRVNRAEENRAAFEAELYAKRVRTAELAKESYFFTSLQDDTSAKKMALLMIEEYVGASAYTIIKVDGADIRVYPGDRSYPKHVVAKGKKVGLHNAAAELALDRLSDNDLQFEGAIRHGKFCASMALQNAFQLVSGEIDHLDDWDKVEQQKAHDAKKAADRAERKAAEEAAAAGIPDEPMLEIGTPEETSTLSAETLFSDAD